MIEQLRICYQNFHGAAKLPRGLARRASPPLLLYPHERWARARVKLLVIGQETLRWPHEPTAARAAGTAIRSFEDFAASTDAVRAMWDLYNNYALGRQYPRLNSPFWRGFRALDAALNTEVDSALWTNLYKVNVGGSVIGNCTKGDIARIQKVQKGLLLQEIRVLQPQVVVFFTGPRYDAAIRAECENAEFQLFDHKPNPTLLIPLSTLAVINAPGLPSKTLRCYHPEYLQRSRQLSLISMIAAWAKG